MNSHSFTIADLHFAMEADERGIRTLRMSDGPAPVSASPAAAPEPSEGLLKEAERQLREYLYGKRQAFDLPLKPRGTAFQKQVWRALEDIPYGESRSYRNTAEMIGNPAASRAVGMACNRNPIPLIIPCHRVVGSSGKLTGYAYGLGMKRRLLALERIAPILKALEDHYGSLHGWWPAAGPFEMMVGAVLTQNTNWQNVEKALAALEGSLSPKAMRKMPLEELAQRIRPSGYYNQKALKLKALCSWLDNYGDDTEALKKRPGSELREELLAISGVGRETADSILVYALDKPFFIIDAYTRRIFGRAGLDMPTDYDGLRALFEGAREPDAREYGHLHGLIVEHAKAFCLKTPSCEGCPLGGLCDRNMRF